MSPTIYFIHGTGVRNVAAPIKLLQERGARLGWLPERVKAIEWGNAVGPKPLEISLAFPPPPRSARSVDDATEPDLAAQWGLLLAYPYAELRVIAQGLPVGDNSGSGELLAPGKALPSVELVERLGNLLLASEIATAAGVKPDAVTAAGSELAGSELVTKAADNAGGGREVAYAIARATVAIVLSAPAVADEDPPLALYDPVARTGLVNAVAAALVAGSESEAERAGRGWIGNTAKSAGIAVLATALKTNRAAAMTKISKFLRDVAYYLQHGETIRGFIAEELRKHSDDSPVVVLAHSLGGIAAVDLLSDPAVMSGPAKLKVDQLITVGSQAPYLYLLDSLHVLSPTKPNNPKPFEPWLNIYNREDLLSFCAERVFGGSRRIHDEELVADVPFPAAHSAYWAQDGFYDILHRYRLP